MAQEILDLRERQHEDRENARELARETRDLAVDLQDKNEKKFVLKAEIKPVVLLVYGLAAAVFTSVIGAVLTGTIHLPIAK